MLFLALPDGFHVGGGVSLGLEVELPLLAGAFAAGAWGAVSGRDRRVLLGALVALALLGPAYDPAGPPERLGLALLAALLFLLSVEFGLLHARVTRLAAMPRAHVLQAGERRELDVERMAGRIAQSWATPLAAAMGLLGLTMAVLYGMRAVLPGALGASIELRGPFGFAFSAALVLGLGAIVARRKLRAEASASAHGN